MSMVATGGPVVGLYADPTIAPCLTCVETPARGTAADVAARLGVPELARQGLDGSNVLLAIVDTGINLDFLRSKGKKPKFSVSQSWTPTVVPPLAPPLVPGQLDVDHGTMCAFDALIAASNATLLDIAVLQSRRHGASIMDGLLRDAVLGFAFLLRVVRSLGRPGSPRSLVVSNSWGMYNRSSDFPPGTSGNYSDNPQHPFNRIVHTLERAGADILFAAGNCGRECPDFRCDDERDAGIYGANSHPQVLSVTGVDIAGERVGYATRGPGHLERQKPDVGGYTHFTGSGVEAIDSGTSAATPVVAGLVAALRNRFPSGPSATPEMIRDVLRRTANNPLGPGFDVEYGFGVANGSRLSRIVALSGGPDGGAVEAEPPLPTHQPGLIGVGFMDQNQAFFRALEAFEQAQPAMGISAAPSFAAVAPGDVCSVYAKAKPILQGILPILNVIPGFGPRVATAVRALMAGLDNFCGSDAAAVGVPASMMAVSPQHGEFFDALAAFQPSGMVTTAAVTAASVDICGIYRTVKPILSGVLPFLSLIPGIGAAVGAAISALMAALDLICPA